MLMPSTPIASLVRSMLADGVEHDAIVRAVAVAESNIPQRRSDVNQERGTRLPSDWEIPETFIQHAAERGMPAARIALEAEKFKNYWTAKSGQGAVKRDWFATWRNWVLTAMEGSHAAGPNRSASGTSPTTRRAQTGANAVLAGMGRLAHRLAQGRGSTRSDGQMAPDPDVSCQLDLDPHRT